MIDVDKFDMVILNHWNEEKGWKTVSTGIQKITEKHVILDQKLEIKGKVLLTLVCTSPDERGGYEALSYIEIEGELSGDKIQVTDYRDNTTWNEGFLSSVQALIPDGVEFLAKYNEDIFWHSVESNTTAIITASAGKGGIRSQKVEYTFVRGQEILFSLNPLDPVLHHLKVSKSCTMILTPQKKHKKLNLIQVSGRVKSLVHGERDVKVHFEPIRMQYGKMTELETYVFKKKSILEELREGYSDTKDFIAETLRIPLVLESLIPFFVGAFLGGMSEVPLFLLSGIALILLQLGSNLLNDYFDYRSQNDEYYYRPIFGVESPHGSRRIIQHDLLLPGQALLQASGFIIVGGVLGLYVNSLTGGTFVLLLGVIGVVFALFYTAPPIRLAHHGLGELTIVITWSVLPFLGGYYIQSGSTILPDGAWIVISVLSSLTFFMVILAGYVDVEADKRADKKTLAVILGRKNIPQVLSIVTFCVIVISVVYTYLQHVETKFLVVVLPLAWILTELRKLTETDIYQFTRRIYALYVITGITALLVVII